MTEKLSAATIRAQNYTRDDDNDLVEQWLQQRGFIRGAGAE